MSQYMYCLRELSKEFKSLPEAYVIISPCTIPYSSFFVCKTHYMIYTLWFPCCIPSTDLIPWSLTDLGVSSPVLETTFYRPSHSPFTSFSFSPPIPLVNH